MVPLELLERRVRRPTWCLLMAKAVEAESLRKEILKRLCSVGGRVVSFEEIRRWLDTDMRVARRVLAELIREGLVERLPDYESRRMGFKASGNACREPRL